MKKMKKTKKCYGSNSQGEQSYAACRETAQGHSDSRALVSQCLTPENCSPMLPECSLTSESPCGLLQASMCPPCLLSQPIACSNCPISDCFFVAKGKDANSRKQNIKKHLNDKIKLEPISFI